jgi:hypothetical protein
MMLATSSRRSALLFAAGWGGVLAFSPILASGHAGYDQSLLRVSEAGVPAVLLLFQSLTVVHQKPSYRPEA